MLKSISLFTLVLGAFFTFAIFSSYTEGNGQPASATSNEGSTNLPQIVRSVDLNKSFNFAGEEVPVTTNFDARERLDRELLRNAYWHSNTLLNIKKAARYFPTMERILTEQGVPTDFKYLAVAESDLMNATSPAGAKGYWQFMKPTGRAYGLEIGSDVDERMHLEKATVAAAKYLKKSKEEFGSWTLAAAAYNMGGTRLRKDIKVQRAKSYYDLNLNQETMRYVFRIIAIKEILSNPEAFGFQINESEKYPPLESVNIKVTKSIPNLGDYAKENGITYRMLKIYNPWLTSSKLTNKSGKTYYIKLPKQN